MKLVLILTLFWSGTILWIALCKAAADGDRIMHEYFERRALPKTSSTEANPSTKSIARRDFSNRKKHSLGRWLNVNRAVR